MRRAHPSTYISFDGLVVATHFSSLSSLPSGKSGRNGEASTLLAQGGVASTSRRVDRHANRECRVDAVSTIDLSCMNGSLRV